MPRFGGAVIRMHISFKEKIKVFVGQEDLKINSKPLRPFHEIVCKFLSQLSLELLSDAEAKSFPDIITFAYWCRKSNIQQLKKQFTESYIRLGRGYVFHIAPSNVPINFAFSFAFSLLAGNANIVRVSSKDFPQSIIISRVVRKLLEDSTFHEIAERTIFIQYEPDNEITKLLSANCDARIIWGGDQTINSIRKLAIPARSIEVSFADRYSFCVIHSKQIIFARPDELKKLALKFYNDTFLMDQNSCSSPHLLIWLGDNDEALIAKKKFWKAVYELVLKQYELQPIRAVDKYTDLCGNAIEVPSISEVTKYGNYIYCIKLDHIPNNIDELRGRYGSFYEYITNDLNTVSHIVNRKYQTLTYFGVDKSQLIDFVLENKLSGIDRIVPIGSAHDISIIWDGYDLIRTLSRICDVK